MDPVAFWSYARHDDESADGWLSDLRVALATEIRTQTGERFTIHQDRTDVLWGQAWKDRIEESIDGSTFLIPIVSPSFLKSKACRDEVLRFLKRQEELGRDDLIMPIYYVNCPPLEDDSLQSGDDDPLISALKAAQRIDWREMRFAGLKSTGARKLIAKMAEEIVAALARTAHDTGGTGQSASDDDDESEPEEDEFEDDDVAGFLDNLADIELYFEGLTATLERISETVEALGAETDDLDISAATSGSQRVAILGKLNARYQPHADSLESDAEAYADMIQRVDGALRGLFADMVGREEISEEDRTAFLTFVDTVVGLDASAAEGLVQMEELSTIIVGVGGLSRVIRPTTRRIGRSLRDVASSKDIIHSWSVAGTDVRSAILDK